MTEHIIEQMLAYVILKAETTVRLSTGQTTLVIVCPSLFENQKSLPILHRVPFP